jgi:hypothetical protein
MTMTACVRNDEPVTSNETVWQRLHRIAEARRKHLRLTQPGVRAAGGPSIAWQAKLPYKTEEPSPRHVEALDNLDKALRWRAGTSWRLLTEDRSGWSEDVLLDEEESLVNEPDRVALMAFMVEQRLNAVDEVERERLIKAVARTLGLPVLG